MLKTFKLNINIFIFFLFFFVNISYSQDTIPLLYKIKAGAFLHYNKVYNSVYFFEIPNYKSCCNYFDKGYGSGWNLGLLAEIPVYNNFFTSLRLGYQTTNNIIYNSEHPIFGIDGTPYQGTTDYQVETNFSALHVDIMAGYNFNKVLNVYAGFTYLNYISQKFNSYEKLIDPPFGTFENDKRIRNEVNNKDLPNASGYDFSLMTGVSYDFPLNTKKTITLGPEMFFYYSFVPVIDKFDWNLFGFRLGAAIKFSRSIPLPLFASINQNIKPILIEDYYSCEGNKTNFSDNKFIFYPEADAKSGIESWNLIVKNGDKLIKEFKGEESIPNQLVLEYFQDSANINKDICKYNYTFSVIDKEGKTESSSGEFEIHRKKYELKGSLVTKGQHFNSNKLVDIAEFKLERTISTNLHPLLNYVFFDANTAILNPKYKKLKLEDAENFSIDNLYHEATEGTYQNILNIIGRRLYEYPQATITITGSTAGVGEEENNFTLAKMRAKTIANYFQKIWQVNEERITIKAAKGIG